MRKHKRNHELLIFISLNYDFLDVFYKITAQKIYIGEFLRQFKHSRPCCIRDTTITFASNFYVIEHVNVNKAALSRNPSLRAWYFKCY